MIRLNEDWGSVRKRLVEHESFHHLAQSLKPSKNESHSSAMSIIQEAVRSVWSRCTPGIARISEKTDRRYRFRYIIMIMIIIIIIIIPLRTSKVRMEEMTRLEQRIGDRMRGGEDWSNGIAGGRPPSVQDLTKDLSFLCLRCNFPLLCRHCSSGRREFHNIICRPDLARVLRFRL